MAAIAPFRALRYDPARVGADPAAVLAPPYDVIGDAERAALEARHPKNAVHVDLPRGQGDEKYTHAAALFDAWIAEGTLRRDDKPALYRYVQNFRYPNTPQGQPYERRGFIALVQLQPFSARVVLPHERTLSAPKADRLALMRAARAHLSQIFGLYRDPEGRAESALRGVEDAPPLLDATTADGSRHRLWALTDQAGIKTVVDALADRQILIADGHHRYETMVALRDELRPPGAASGTSPADWGTMFLARAEDPGLLVLPTHRLVRGLPSFDLAALRARAEGTFIVEEGDETEPAAIEQRLLRQGASRPVFAVRAAGHARTVWLTLAKGADLSSLGAPALQRLDVTVLHGIVLGPMLGIDQEAMAKQSYLAYTHDTAEALARVDAGDVQAAFFMNATKVDEVLTVCEAGFFLPQKSTYFQPKLATGTLFFRIDPAASIDSM